MEGLEARCLLSGTVDVLSYHGGEPTNGGVNAAEVQLTPGNVKVSTFGKQFSTPVDGQVYAEPLVKTGVNITTGAFKGLHDVAFVATEHDSLYAIDANGGNVLWHDSFIYNAGGNTNPLNATIPAGVTTIAGGFGTETNSQDIQPEIGIVATPIIDAKTGYIYFTAKTREARGDENNPHFVYRLHKVRLADGLDTSVVVADTTLHKANTTYTYNSGPYTIGNGAGFITVNGQNRVYFNAVRQMNRPALSIVNGRLYTAWASHGDNGPYHGWVLTFDPASLALNGVLNTTPNGGEGEAGIWQGGGGLTFDSTGAAYFETGNGLFDGNNANGVITGLDGNGFPAQGDYGDCFVKITTETGTSQGNQGTNKNGWGLKVVDYFSPYNNHPLDSADRDLGSGAPIVLPNSAGSAAHPHLLVGSGKEGKLYLIDRDNMGKYGTTDNIVQTVGGAINGSLDTPAFFNGRLYYTSGYGGTGASWPLSNGVINTAGKQVTPDSFGFPGTSPYISANGTLNGIAWMIDRGTGQLRAYDAANIANELWTSNQNAARDSLGSAIKFTVATPVNGRVYVGTADHLVVYGPPQPPTSGPAAPTGLTAVATGPSTIVLKWADNSANEDGFKIERSPDGVNFTAVASAGVNATTFTDSGLSPSQKYYYRVRAYNSFNSLTYSAFTNTANATTTALGAQAPIDVYHFDENSGTVAADAVGGNNGALVGTPRPTWVAPGRVGTAALSFSGDGQAGQTTSESAVKLANDLSPILGGTSSLAVWIKTTQVGNDTHYNAPAITGVEQAGGSNDIQWGWLDASGHIGLYVGDNAGVQSTNPINDGTWHHIAMTRDAATGQVKLYVDGVLNATATAETGAKTSQFKLIGALSDVAADGTTFNAANYLNGQLDDVRIYNQVLDPAEVLALAKPPAAPTNLIVTAASGTQLNLAWTDVATTEVNYEVERSISGGAWQQIALLPANSTSYMDGGLSQGTTYAYRVRASNTAGFSGYSNTVSTATPGAPLTPTGAVTTFVSPTEIDLKWTDNANNETGYKVLRNSNGGQFAEIANLPANTTSYKDLGPGGKGLTPGVTYDYHIQAYNIAGYSDFTGLTATTLPLAPTNLIAAPNAQGITLTWSAGAGAVTYNVWRGTSSLGESATPIATGVTTTTFTDTKVTKGQRYYYAITPVDAGGQGRHGNEASAIAGGGGSATPPHVVGVTLAGSTWSAAYFNYLNAAKLGVGGYAVPAGARQAMDGPWSDANQVRVRFDQNVIVSQGDLTLAGVNVKSRAISGFSYDPSTYTATWTLAAPIIADRLKLDLADTVHTAAGAALDGEWTNNTDAFPSGNGAAGGHFIFTFNVLPGDANADGVVNGLDVTRVQSYLGKPLSAAFTDVNGDGVVNATDVNIVNANLGKSLPVGAV